MNLFSSIHKNSKLGIGLVLAVLIIGISTHFLSNHPKISCNNCNVILVSIDTLAAQHLPCYGYERNTAPNLCSFASRNLLFKNSFSQSTITLDSHFSIFTSLYPHTHKMNSISGPPLDEKYLTLAQVLRSNGYETEYKGTLTDPYLPLNRGIERGFNGTVGFSNISTWGQSYKLLEENAKKNKKTFIFLHTYEVHAPYLTGHSEKHLYTTQKEYPQIPLTFDEYGTEGPDYLEFVVKNSEELAAEKRNKTSGLSSKADLVLAKQMEKEKKYEEKVKIYNKMSILYRNACLELWWNKFINKNDQSQVAYLKALYDERIHQADVAIKKLLDLVESPKFSKNTILIITADHGEEFMEHGNLYHTENLFTTTTSVPLIMHVPGIKPRRIQEYVEGIDIYPTVLSILGLKPKSPIEGIDLSGIIKGDKNAVKNKFLLSELKGKSAMQMDNWRFYYDYKLKKALGLYNLAMDPKEEKNVVDDNKNKTIMFLNLIGKLNIPSD